MDWLNFQIFIRVVKSCVVQGATKQSFCLQNDLQAFHSTLNEERSRTQCTASTGVTEQRGNTQLFTASANPANLFYPPSRFPKTQVIITH